MPPRSLVDLFEGSFRDAQKELARMQAAADAGVLVDPTSQTVGAYLADFFDSVQTLSPKTLERYVELAQRQIIPHVGDVKLQKLTPELIERWHATLIKTGLSARTVGHAHRVLSRVLRRAVENGTLAMNVAAIRKPPRVAAAEVEILPPDQMKIVLAGLADHALHPITVLALATGARRGELLALKWTDVDLDRGTIRIERSLEETKAGLRIKPTKTKRGRRSIRITSDAVVTLKTHLRQQRELRLQLGIGGQPTLLFSTLEGELLSPDKRSRDWLRIISARKLPRVSFHALCHTHASVLIHLGWDILKVSRRLGHDKPSTTLNVYGHLIKDTDDAAVAQMEGMLK